MIGAPHPSPTGAARRSLTALVLLALALAMLPVHDGTATPTGKSPLQTASSHPFGERTESISDRHVYDFAHALSDPEIATIAADANRLQRFGMPAVIITTTSGMAPNEAAQVAASVREDWDIATTPGAEDGLVFLVVLPEAAGGTAYATLSWGAHALPLDGLTATVSEDLYQQWVSPWLAEPRVFEAVTYGLRRMIYHVIYDPAPQIPLTGAPELAHNVVGWVGILAVIAFMGSSVASRFGWRLAFPGNLALLPGWLTELVPFLAIALLAAASVFGESDTGIACSGLLLFGCLYLWVRTDPPSRAVGNFRVLGVTPGKRVSP